MHIQFCQGHRVHTKAALTTSKLQEWQPLPEAPSACAVFPSFIAPKLSVKSSALFCSRFQEGCKEKHLEFPGIEPLGTWDLRGVGGSPQNSQHCCFSLHHAQLRPGSSHPTSWGHGKEPGLAQTRPRPLESNETRAAVKLSSQNPGRHLKGTAGEVTVIVAK